MTNTTTDTNAEKLFLLPPWSQPYTKNQSKFFMAVLYEGGIEGEQKFDTKYLADGNELVLLMLSNDVTVESVYVVSFPEPATEQVLMEFVDEIWMGVISEESKEKSVCYIVRTMNDSHHVFSKLGEVSESLIKHKSLFFSSTQQPRE